LISFNDIRSYDSYFVILNCKITLGAVRINCWLSLQWHIWVVSDEQHHSICNWHEFIAGLHACNCCT
jgi:hypothetical protein